MYDTIIFDLDGTLLPMDQNIFLNGYFSKIAAKFPEYNLELFMKALQYAVKGMIENDGKVSNEERFWELFYKIHPYDSIIEERFLHFYNNEFQELIAHTSPTPLAKQVIDTLLNKGYQLICCTNPVFPQIATYSRIKWAGLDYNNFTYITTFENSKYCKPNLLYYQEVIQKYQLNANLCLMIGNDVFEDMGVRKLGMSTYLLDDNLINHKGLPIEVDYQGNFKDLVAFVAGLPER